VFTCNHVGQTTCWATKLEVILGKMNCLSDRFHFGSILTEGHASHESPESKKCSLESVIPDQKVQLAKVPSRL